MKKNNYKKLIIASSGSGGHVYPGIALARELEKHGYDITFFIVDNTISMEILNNSNFKYIKFNMSGMPKKFSIKFLKFLFTFCLNLIKALIKIKKIDPIIVIGMGGYITVPIIIAAKILKKITFIHEQNVIPGKANILLSKIVNKTFISFKQSKKYINNAFFSGCPIRKEIFLVSRITSFQKFGFNNRIPIVLVVGGSLGFISLNQIIFNSLIELSVNNKLQVLHITGLNKDFFSIKRKTKNVSNYKVFQYIHNIEDAYTISNIIICRSGASTIFEMNALEKAAILIPYSKATDNHQYWNAKAIENDYRKIIEENDITKKKLINILFSIIKEDSNRKKTIYSKSFAQELIAEEIIKELNYICCL
ncbi:MAG: UDP-N-acetylglucosamine--N-acetylmuramyl-(pentapeptide) pyrophosphoryl-undecaprenol N-acetylglucosamine transferase [Endomicrobium sp.]|jgi:UDP-N-acetylglucosamine--N-acetylmuramyl-(pentapeptide) pyrophosphoryl-undecaprenol N-acetylglucosamine transferase|nr:UDP-N-acetylglucosamine--N-acetylmuramyl-(pentapeptide) pyrophosphoryl-undecaprenol N-acetylglucosamine transferase [Endomicrobium sp.]